MIFSGKVPRNLGIKDGRLSPCPRKSNCVCSHTEDPNYFIAPLNFSGHSGDAVAALTKLLKTQKNVEIITCQKNYIHAECKSSILGFVDDLELLWDEKQGLFHVRSASRLGYSDFGVNRKRIENLRNILEKQ